MIHSFKNKATEDIFNGLNTKEARSLCPQSLWQVAFRKLDQLDSATTIDVLRIPPGNHLEKLIGDQLGKYSIRINKQYRICFFWAENGAQDVEIIDYH
jgi:toxin HigB-1